MQRLALPFAFAALLLAATLSGCAASGDSSTAVYVQDATSDTFKEVHLVVTHVRIHTSHNANESAGWLTLYDGAPVDVDLMNATGNKAFFLGSAATTPGKYQQVRITASEAYGITKAGAKVTIELPEKDLKLVKGFKVVEGKETRIVVDVDLDKSVKQKGSTWEMRPVIGKIHASLKEKKDHHSGDKEDVDDSDDANEA